MVIGGVSLLVLLFAIAVYKIIRCCSTPANDMTMETSQIMNKKGEEVIAQKVESEEQIKTNRNLNASILSADVHISDQEEPIDNEEFIKNVFTLESENGLKTKTSRKRKVNKYLNMSQ